MWKMRVFLQGLCLGGSRTPLFRAHVHSSPCVICEAAVNKLCETSGTLPKADVTHVVPSALPHHAESRGVAERGGGGWLTVAERRREALRVWMQNADKWGDVRRKAEKTYLETCWEAFCDPERTLTDDDIAGTIDFLDKFCEIKTHGALGTQESSSELEKEGNTESCASEKISENAFLARLEGCITLPEEIERQLRFQRALLDFRTVANALQLSFFLCCGTALGVHREGHFIPHDNDIDVGVFFESLLAVGNAMGDDVQSVVVSILSHMTLDGKFLLLDLCGMVTKGLELRFLHHETQVPLDLNVYYSPLVEDAGLVEKFGPFVWTATHYENATARRHGMYRYRHVPFRSLLLSVPFCDSAAPPDACGFLVPPLQYLVECFGHDWQIPKKFTYTEGLRNGEYKNIIDE